MTSVLPAPAQDRRGRSGHEEPGPLTLNSSTGNPSRDAGAVVAPPVQALLAAAGVVVRDAQARERFGDIGPAFAAAFGSWLEPFAAAMQGLEPTPRSRAAARALADVARLVGAFACEATRRDATHPPVGTKVGRTDVGPPNRSVHGGTADEEAKAGSQDVKAAGEDVEAGSQRAEASGGDEEDGGAGSYEHYVRLATQVDDSFREFSSSPEFDHARRRAAVALLDWLEHDRAAASSIARAFEVGAAVCPERPRGSLPTDPAYGVPNGATHPERRHGGPLADPMSGAANRAIRLERQHGSMAPPGADPAPAGVSLDPESTDPDPAGAVVIMRDGNAVLVRYPAKRAVHARVLVIPGFSTGAHIFDLGSRRSVVRTLAEHGVETWLLDWGRTDETDRLRTVANQLDRIDRAIDTIRAAADGRSVALAGHFHGGLLALLYCIRYPGKAGALVVLSTPVEFVSTGDVFGDWLRTCGGERFVDVFGNVPGALIAALLAAASPMQWWGGGFFTLLDSMDSTAGAARVARFEHARRFPPAFPGETFRGLCRSFYRDNSFVAGGSAVIDDHEYDLSSLATPLLNVFAREDRIVPPGASSRLEELVGATNCSRREHPGGHFDLLTGHRAHTELLPDVAAWLIEHVPRS